MSSPAPSSKFSLDLDEKINLSEGTEKVLPEKVKKEEKKEEKKVDVSQSTILPVPINGEIVCKDINDVTSDEFISWLQSVMPMSPELTQEILKMKGGKTKNLSDLKVRSHMFDTVVSLHEQRWLFGRGKAKTERNN